MRLTSRVKMSSTSAGRFAVGVKWPHRLAGLFTRHADRLGAPAGHLGCHAGRFAIFAGHMRWHAGRLATQIGRLESRAGHLAGTASRFAPRVGRLLTLVGPSARWLRPFAPLLATSSPPAWPLLLPLGRFWPPCVRSPRPMPYTKRDLIERSGLPDRTIRNYIGRGLLPRPRGHGLAAEYDEEHMVRAVTIGRMRAQGQPIDAIGEQIAGWSTAKFKRFVARTEPPEEQPAPPPDPPHSGDLEPPSPPAAVRQLGARQAVKRAESEHAAPGGEIDLPDAPSWRIYPLISGLGLLVDTQASPVVHRIAAEIVGKYGRGPAGR
jgi:DNA-binding transcriptional MerR regulator